MKKLLGLLFVLSTLTANAGLVKTKLQAKIKFVDIAGKVTSLPPVRVYITHDTEVNLLNLSKAQECEVEVGKKDILSLGLETEKVACVATRDRIIVENDALLEILTRSGMFTLRDHFDRMYEIVGSGTIVNTTLGNSQLGNTLGNIFGQLTKLQQISINSSTDFILSDKSNREKYTIELTPKKVEYLD